MLLTGKSTLNTCNGPVNSHAFACLLILCSELKCVMLDITDYTFQQSLGGGEKQAIFTVQYFPKLLSSTRHNIAKFAIYIKGTHGECSSPIQRSWSGRGRGRVGICDAPSDLRLPSQSHSITARRLVPNYTARWQRHMYVMCERPVQGRCQKTRRPGV